MRLTDIRTDIRAYAPRQNIDTQIDRAINQAQDEIISVRRWPFMRTEGTLFTVARYTTGNCNVTNGSRTLSGGASAPVWTRLMIGRKFRLSSSTPIYRITGFTSATSLTLDRPYDGSTASNQTYEIYEDELLLPADMDVSRLFRSMNQPLPMAAWDTDDFDYDIQRPDSTSAPRVVLFIGKSLVPFVHQVGSVTISSGAKALTGTSTSWLTTPKGIGRMSKIRIVENVYHIQSIDSDTGITLYEDASAAVTASTDWEFLLDQPWIQVWPIPDDEYQIQFRYYRRPQPLSDPEDVPDLPEDFHDLVFLRAMAQIFLLTGEGARHDAVMNAFDRRLAQMVLQFGSPSTDMRLRLKSLDEANGDGVRGPRFPSTYPDVRFIP